MSVVCCVVCSECGVLYSMHVCAFNCIFICTELDGTSGMCAYVCVCACGVCMCVSMHCDDGMEE